MDLTGWLRPSPRPLIVTALGGRSVRLAVERLTREWGWEQAAAPAEADLLVVCGTPDATLADAVERVWAQLPSPRARVGLHRTDTVAAELGQARARLADDLAATSHTVGGARGDQPECEESTEHPGGLPMADRAPDRDGLTLDQLHVSLGPVLADWPAGLVVRLTLQGDVVQSAQVEVARAPSVRTRTVDAAPADGRCAWLPGAAAPSGGEVPAAAALDGLARLLAVCGASTAARTARRLRDDLLAGTLDDAELRRFARRLRRSRTLRWATDGVGRLDERHGELGGDATRRWHRWLDTAQGGGAPADPADDARVALAELPDLLEGTELAAARVVVASLDPDLDALALGPTR